MTRSAQKDGDIFTAESPCIFCGEHRPRVMPVVVLRDAQRIRELQQCLSCFASWIVWERIPHGFRQVVNRD